MKKFCLILFCCLNCTFGLRFTQYDRNTSLSSTEKKYLYQLIKIFDGPHVSLPLHSTQSSIPDEKISELIKKFIACSKSGFVKYKNTQSESMLPILHKFAKNPVGRELMYRIIAKLEPGISCVMSIDSIINPLRNAKKDYSKQRT